MHAYVQLVADVLKDDFYFPEEDWATQRAVFWGGGGGGYCWTAPICAVCANWKHSGFTGWLVMETQETLMPAEACSTFRHARRTHRSKQHCTWHSLHPSLGIWHYKVSLGADTGMGQNQSRQPHHPSPRSSRAAHRQPLFQAKTGLWRVFRLIDFHMEPKRASKLGVFMSMEPVN